MTDPTPDPTASLRTMVADALEHLAGLLRDDTGTLKTVVSTWVDDRLKAAISSQPQRLGLPVTEPNSLPRLANCSPM